MASQFVDGRSNGHGTDPHSASRGTRISISPTTPDHSPRFPNFALLKGPGERKITKGMVQGEEEAARVALLIIAPQMGRYRKGEAPSLIVNQRRTVDKN